MGGALRTHGGDTNAPVVARPWRSPNRVGTHAREHPSFFLNGARARGYIGVGPDGVPGSADDVLTATGETLTQIQTRVLGGSGASSSLFPTIPGYGTFGVRAGFRAGRHQIVIDAENLNDRNYRGLSWGLDAPGRGLTVKYVARF